MTQSSASAEPIGHERILISYDGRRLTGAEPPTFPFISYHSGLVVYQEAFIDRQYLGVHWSALGRPTSRERVWQDLVPDATSPPWTPRPETSRLGAFVLEVDGQLLADRWQWVNATVEEPRRDGQECTVVLAHEVRPVQVAVHTRVDANAFLSRWLTISNLGHVPLAIAQVATWAGRMWQTDLTQFVSHNPEATSAFALGRFRSGDAREEGRFGWEAVPNGTLKLEHLRGRSGHDGPWFFLRNEVTNDLFVTAFAWSGNWQAEFHSDFVPGSKKRDTASLYFRLGLAGPAPVRVLLPGENAETPSVHIGHLFGDLDAAVQALHNHTRSSTLPSLPTGIEHLVSYNHTGYTLNAQITEDALLDEVALADDVGVELFVIDAGWFGGVIDSAPNAWYTAVGDWTESPLLAGRLRNVFDRIHELGMLAGLWVEIERAGSGSRLMKERPEWEMTRRGHGLGQLDLSLPEVQEHIVSVVSGLVERYALDCLRIDYNIQVGEGGDHVTERYVESTMWRYYDGLYSILDRLRERFPRLLIENCSGGGGRLDLGMMSRAHWTQITDAWAPKTQLGILNGISMVLPPEVCMPLLGAIDRGVSDIDFNLRIGLFGHFAASGLYPSIDEANLRAREQWRHTIGLYKGFVRPYLSRPRSFHHTPFVGVTDAPWCVLEHASEDGSRAIVGLFRLQGNGHDTYRIRPRGLRRGKRYRVTYDSSGDVTHMEGDVLADQGTVVRVAGGLQSELLLFEANSGN